MVSYFIIHKLSLYDIQIIQYTDNTDVVMQDLEIACLNSVNCQLTFYYRYVDDIVMAAPKENL